MTREIEINKGHQVKKQMFSLKVGAPIVAASVATLALSNSLIVMLAGRPDLDALQRLQAVWPLALTSGTAIILVMSFLYSTILDFIRDVERREAEARHLALHDALTDLPNRSLFADRLQQAVAGVKRGSAGVAVLTLDLDHFKSVNDTLGHLAGDQLIREFANRIKPLLRSSDTVARLGGDEFAVIQLGVKKLGDAEALCLRILEAGRQTFKLDGGEISASVSIGAALAPGSGTDPTELLRKSDMALYRAKSDGRGRFHIFTEQTNPAGQPKAGHSRNFGHAKTITPSS